MKEFDEIKRTHTTLSLDVGGSLGWTLYAFLVVGIAAFIKYLIWG